MRRRRVRHGGKCFRGDGEVNSLDFRGTGGVSSYLDPPARLQFCKWVLIEERRSVSAKTHTSPLPSCTDWVRHALEMCLEMVGSLHDALVDGEYSRTTWSICLPI